MVDRYQMYKAALDGMRLPLLFLDLDQMDANIRVISHLSRKKTVRVATKSIRSVAILRHILSRSSQFQGLMAYSVAEAVWLSSLGFTDILTGYPTTEPNDLEAAATAASILSREGNASKGEFPLTFMACAQEHLDVLSELSRRCGIKVGICIDVDHSLSLPGLHFGVRRSPLRDTADVMAFARATIDREGLILRGVMGYEAQVAGVPDIDPAGWMKNGIIRLLKSASLRQIARLRRDIRTGLDELRNQSSHPERLPLDLFNGGGTGSLHTTFDDPTLTELTAGSGFYAPSLFDHYAGLRLQPAMGFALRVTRLPAYGWVTCHGGGYIASGAVGKNKQPKPWLPVGLSLSPLEGAGEVQTPLQGLVSDLRIGDPVFFRHAKAGEPCEHFNEIHLIRGNQHAGIVKTYRGEGKKFI
jgi:D-serine deaminase-like pyridoxal phosphate-dependent protein